MAGSIRMGNMHDLDRFMTGQHSDMQSKTTHNLSSVEGASMDHGSPAEHKEYAKYHADKADWHYRRWGNPRQPQASLAKAGVHDFKSRVAGGWPK